VALLDILRKKPLDKLSTDELRIEEMRLRNQIEKSRKDLNQLDKKKKAAFQEAVGADQIKKKMAYMDYKQLDTEQRLLAKDNTILMKQLTFISNLVVIKKYESRLRKSPIWNKITTIPESELENALLKVNLRGEKFEDVLNGLNGIFEEQILQSETQDDPDFEEFLQATQMVESNEMNVDDAEKQFIHRVEDEKH